MAQRKLSHYLEYIVTRTFGFILNLLPYSWAMRFGDFLGWVCYRILHIRRKITLTNMKAAFKDAYSPEELDKIGLSSYQIIAKSFVDYILFPSLKNKVLEITEFEGKENFDKALKKGKGAILVTGHFGSWELMGAAIAKSGYATDFLVGEQHNTLIDDVMNDYRQLMGIGIIKMGVAAKGVIKALKNNRFVAMLSDQDAGGDGTIVNFFGMPASTPKGPAAFALKTGAPIVTGGIIRDQTGVQKIKVEEPIYLETSGNKEEDIQKLTQIYTSILENYIRKYPDHWFWPHRRWKNTVKGLYK
ncbi:MAG: lysophospholipid acyltransferase family protein [candidate division Zixibacteria bacterium]|nr:lysophospholipid acyltransferase family protein [candidate division Zixibacteria bacterium]